MHVYPANGPPPDGWSAERWASVCAYGDTMYRRDFAPMIEERPGWQALAGALRQEARRVVYAQIRQPADGHD